MSTTTDVWVLSRDLIGAPGLPSSLSTIIRRASREGWVRRRRQSDRSTKGVEYEYLLSSLPEIIGEVVQARMARQVIAQSAGADLPVVRGNVMKPDAGSQQTKVMLDLYRNCPALMDNRLRELTDDQKKIADARMTLVREALRLMQKPQHGGMNMNRKQAVTHIALESKAGTLPEHAQKAAMVANARK